MLTATFIGYAAWGPVGAAAATVAIFFPSWVVLVTTAPRFHTLTQRAAIQVMIRGIVASFVGMLLSILLGLGGAVLTEIPTVLLAAAAFIALSWGAGLQP